MLSHWYSRLASAVATLAFGTGALFISGCHDDCDSCSDNDTVVQPVTVSHSDEYPANNVSYRSSVRSDVDAGYNTSYDVDHARYYNTDEEARYYGRDWDRSGVDVRGGVRFDRDRDWNHRDEARFNRDRDFDHRNDANFNRSDRFDHRNDARLNSSDRNSELRSDHRAPGTWHGEGANRDMSSRSDASKSSSSSSTSTSSDAKKSDSTPDSNRSPNNPKNTDQRQ